MKTLEDKFVENVDSAGKQIFELLNRTDKVAVYQRTKISDNSIFGYEVFQVKTRLKGQPLPGGSREVEDRECYPGKHSFGRTAHFYSPWRKTQALQKFEELSKTPVIEVEEEETIVEETVTTPSPTVVRNDDSKVKVDVKIPSGRFTTQQFGTLNNMPVPGLGYFTLKNLVSGGVVKEVAREKLSSGRGRPSAIYSKV